MPKHSAIEIGPSGLTVAANIKRLRRSPRVSTYELAARLARVGRNLPAHSIAKIERGERRVDIDDLMALAVVFNVSPSALLLPLDDAPTSLLEVTGAGSINAQTAWDWMDGKRPLNPRSDDGGDGFHRYVLNSRPYQRGATQPRWRP